MRKSKTLSGGSVSSLWRSEARAVSAPISVTRYCHRAKASPRCGMRERRLVSDDVQLALSHSAHLATRRSFQFASASRGGRPSLAQSLGVIFNSEDGSVPPFRIRKECSRLRRNGAELAALRQEPDYAFVVADNARVVSHAACNVSHADCDLSNTALARRTFARIVSALAVHVNVFGSRLCAAISSFTLRNTPRRIRLSAMSLNHRSIRFSHELLVGMKCR